LVEFWMWKWLVFSC